MDMKNYLKGIEVLGLDVDGPVYRLGSELRNWLIRRGWKAGDLNPAPVSTYDFLASWPLTQQELNEELLAASAADAIYGGDHLHVDAGYWLPRIHEAGVGVHLVTARSEPRAYAQTEAFFRQHNLPFDRLTLDRNKEDVDGYDLLVDDHPGNVERVLAKGRKAVVLDRAWNRDVTHLPRVTWQMLGEALVA